MITPSWSKIFHRFQAGTTIGSMRENVFKGFQAGNLVSCSKLESKLSVSRFSKLESSKLKIARPPTRSLCRVSVSCVLGGLGNCSISAHCYDSEEAKMKRR